ncbi:MAG: flagellar basal body-associated FliL family protein [Bdellovibrionales bacterium]|nr:flagellar basal body-associated FliL family protein [Bdellovibrionales bacterium]
MADEQAEVKKEKKDLGKLLGIVFAVVNLVVMGGGAFLAFTSTIGYKSPIVTEEELNKELVEFRKKLQEHAVVFTMPEFNTNLDGLPRRLIRVEVNLEMLDEEGFEEVASLGAEPRDAIMRVFSRKKFFELETVQGKLHLKNEIIGAVNSHLKIGVVKNVYFSKFIVQ